MIFCTSGGTRESRAGHLFAVGRGPTTERARVSAVGRRCGRDRDLDDGGRGGGGGGGRHCGCGTTDLLADPASLGFLGPGVFWPRWWPAGFWPEPEVPCPHPPKKPPPPPRPFTGTHEALTYARNEDRLPGGVHKRTRFEGSPRTCRAKGWCWAVGAFPFDTTGHRGHSWGHADWYPHPLQD